MMAPPSISPTTFRRELVVTTWHVTGKTAEGGGGKGGGGIHKLGVEQNVLRDRFFFDLSGRFNWAKRLRWYFQRQIESSPGRTKLISRYNAMRAPETQQDFL